MNNSTGIYLELFNSLQEINLTLIRKGARDNRFDFGDHRRNTFGLVRERFSGKYNVSLPSRKYPKVYNLLLEYGYKNIKHNFTSIHVIKNLTTSKHKDKNNCGISTLVSFGNYSGSKIVIEGEEFDAFENPITFNGYEKEHWNTDDLIGTKYSIIYFNINLPQNIEPLFVYKSNKIIDNITMNIAIPTYNRCDNFKTIKFLKDNGIPNEWITIFVANEDEKDKYISKIGNDYKFIVGVIGICNQRNFITNYYNEDEIIVSIDDDIEDIIHKDNKPLIEWLTDCIDYLKKNNLGLLSVSPSSNPYFFKMKNKEISFKKGNYLAVGVFHIYKNHKDILMDIDCVEDYDRSLMYLKKYGENVRYFDILLKTTYWGKGGLTGMRTKEYYCEQIDKMLKKYPNCLNVRYRLIKQMDKSNKVPIIYMSRKKGSLSI